MSERVAAPATNSCRESPAGAIAVQPEGGPADVVQQFADLIEACDDGVVGKSLDGVIFAWNEGATRLYGYQREDVIGQSIALIIPPERRQELAPTLARVRRGERVERFETVRLHKDGRRLDVSVAISPMRDARGTVVGAVAVARDISRRRRAERALLASEARFSAFMRHLPGAAWMKDLEGRYIYANPEAERVFSRRLEELRGRTDPELFPPETARAFVENDRRALHEERGCQTIETLRQADGVEHRSIVSKFAVPGVDGTPACVGGVAIDVTNWLAAEEALRASEARFRLMANSAPVMIWMSGASKDCSWCNTRWLEFTGRSLEQELGTGWAEGVHRDDLERCMRTYVSAFDERRPFEIEFRLRRFDGAYRWVRDVGVPIHLEDEAFAGYVGSCIDVTDRRASEESLREHVVQRTHELRAANEQLQYEIEERRRVESVLAIENRILELMASGANLESQLAALCEAIESLLPGSHCAIRLARAAESGAPSAASLAAVAGVDLFGTITDSGVFPPVGSERMIVPRVRPESDAALARAGVQSYCLEPIRRPSGTIAGTVAVYSTEAGRASEDALSAAAMAARLAGIAVERGRVESQAREQLAQLAHVARLATMGEMASGLAHELNQPLCAIVNFTEACVELLGRDDADRGQLVQALGEVARQAVRAGEVIRRLREFVRRSEPERHAIEINAVVRNVVGLMEVDARHSDVRIRLRLAKRVPKIYADRVQIEQVLVNLVRNACDAMRESGSPTRTLIIETLRRKGEVEVRVSDSGPGIADEARERLFEPFYTTKRTGMGMGLSISRSILEVHEGRIWVTGNREAGTTFHFTLPTAWRARRGRRHSIRCG